MSSLNLVAEKAVKEAVSLGASEAEVYISAATVREVEAWGKQLNVQVKVLGTCSVRVAIGKKVGIAYVTSTDERAVLETAREAVKLARAAQEDKHWNGLPDPQKPLHSWRRFDEGVVTASVEFMVGLLRDAINRLESRDRRLKLGFASTSCSFGEMCIVNTRGVNAYDRVTRFELSLYAKAREGASESTGIGYVVSHALTANIDPAVERASKLALDGLKAEPLESTLKGYIVMMPDAFAQLLESALIPALYADNAQEGKSPLAGRLGERVFEGSFTLIDDGTLAGGLRTTLYDAEGVPRRRTTLVENGVLKSFLHNTYTARREGRESTGNASRTENRVGVECSNTVVPAGSKALDKLISSLDRAILVDGTLLSAHAANPVTGDFSVVAKSPYLVVNGSVENVLKPVTIAGNIYSAIGADYEAASNVVFTPHGVVTPAVLLQDITASS